jgi:Icc-related predicted phosphoesterase
MRTIPYLQNPGKEEMTVMWLTHVPARSWVEVGTDPGKMEIKAAYLEGVMVANNKIHRIQLQDLQPGTKYYYRVVSQEITRYSSYYKVFGDTVRSEIKSFTTWSDQQRDFRVIVYNDLHSNMKMFEKLHGYVDDKPYDLVIFNGDCFDDVETEADILNRLLTYTPRIKSDEVPSIFLRGNHETRGEHSLQLWDYLGRMGGRSYSAFSLGDTRFVLLDCGEDKPDDHLAYFGMNDFTQHRLNQAVFLKEELKRKEFTKAGKRILIHHIPIFGMSPDSYSPCSDLWIPVLKNAPFNVSLNGHTHRFRVIERDEAGNPFPVVIGGSNREPDGTVMVLEKKGKILTLEVINAAGERLLEKEL